ncbi:hypothetical protein ACWPKS_01260 [Coraliomargarita sp. W4R72]
MRIIVSFFTILMVSSSLLQAAANLRTVRNDHFEVLSFDLRSGSYVNELSVYSIQMAQRYLEVEGLAFPTPILINLRPEAHVDFEGDYRIRVAERGSVQLDLRWEDDMTLERACRAIAEALLLQYSIYNYGTEASTNLRLWPVEALAGEIYYGLRPAKFIEKLNFARENSTSLLTDLVEPLRSDRSLASGNGYWLLPVLKSSHLDRSVIRSLFQQAVAGVDIEKALTAAVQANGPIAEPVTAQAWFTGQFASLLDEEYDVIESMDASRDWLAALANFDTPLVLESGEVTLNLRSLWTHRAEPEVQELLQARYEILLLRMSRINSAYFNPARSLGVLFEGILKDVPSYKHIHYLTIYLSDWEDAKEMQEDVERYLQNK